MCLLSLMLPGVQPNPEHLINGCQSNPDGFGWSMITGEGHLLTQRFMDPTEAILTFIAARKLDPSGPALFHSRYTTHGRTTVANCHPFHPGRNRRRHNLVIAHNGVLPFEVQPRKGDKRSDTRIFAEDFFLGRYRDLDNPATVRRLESWLGYGNRLVILSTDQRLQRDHYILNEDHGDWVEGVWHSNSGYKPYVPVYRGAKSSYSSVKGWDSYGDGSCLWCGVRTADAGYDMYGYPTCSTCATTCNVCYEVRFDCECPDGVGSNALPPVAGEVDEDDFGYWSRYPAAASATGPEFVHDFCLKSSVTCLCIGTRRFIARESSEAALRLIDIQTEGMN